jgi:hypothetical protein
MTDNYLVLSPDSRPETWSRKLLDSFYLWGAGGDVYLCEWTRPGETLYTVSWGEPEESPWDDEYAVFEFKNLADAEAYFEGWRVENAERRP